MALRAQKVHAFRVTLRLLSPGEGGRTRGVASGYRCNCALVPGIRRYNDAVVQLDQGRIEPGRSGTGRLEPVHPDLWTDVGLGAPIDLCEGDHVVGRATVTAVEPL